MVESPSWSCLAGRLQCWRRSKRLVAVVLIDGCGIVSRPFLLFFSVSSSYTSDGEHRWFAVARSVGAEIMGIDLRDFTLGYRCNEASGDLLEINGGLTWPVIVGVGSAAGIIGSDQLSRGLTTSLSNYFDVAFSAGNAFDIRGLTSCTFTGWINIPLANAGGEPWLFGNHAVNDPDGQALAIFTREEITGGPGGGVGAPGISMYDGLTNNNIVFVSASGTLDLLPDVWHFIAGGWDAVRNKVFIFWGRDASSEFYNEADGFAAGFGYVGAPQTASILRYRQQSTTARSLIDHVMWWKGRALSQDELSFLHNSHLGRDFGNLVDDGIVAPTAAQSYYYGRP